MQAPWKALETAYTMENRKLVAFYDALDVNFTSIISSAVVHKYTNNILYDAIQVSPLSAGINALK